MIAQPGEALNELAAREKRKGDGEDPRATRACNGMPEWRTKAGVKHRLRACDSAARASTINENKEH